MEDNTSKNTLILTHEKASSFTSTSSDGAIIAGPHGENAIYSLSFYKDSFRVIHEIYETDPSEPGIAKAIEGEGKGKAEYFREDVALISLSEKSLLSLHRVLTNHIDSKGIGKK
tara:strand:+ start:537 stop:878 length:342 start_codon:yes stop_codon:yes gene_type:complete